MKLTDAQAFCLEHLSLSGEGPMPVRDDITVEDVGSLLHHNLVRDIWHPDDFWFRITDTGRQALRDHREGEG